MKDIIGLFVMGILCGFIGAWGESQRNHGTTHTVEAFSADLTITIQCSGDCDLAAMIAEAREAAEK